MRNELKLIRGGKPIAFLGLPCDSCGRQHEAPGACGECAFLAARQRVLEERHKAKKQRRRAARKEAIH